MRITIGNATLAGYPYGGGHWTVRLQYVRGLRRLGHDVLLLVVMGAKRKPEKTRSLISRFLHRIEETGLQDSAVLAVLPSRSSAHNLDAAELYGASRGDMFDRVRTTDLFLNDCGTINPPLLTMFRNRAYLDGDPGHTQVAALTTDMHFDLHDHLLTVGSNFGNEDCQVPSQGYTWKKFTWFAYLPMWSVNSDPGAEAPVTSVTHWNFGELSLGDRSLSLSKRDAYLRYVDLPDKCSRLFEIAARVDCDSDLSLLGHKGWRVVDPWESVRSPDEYRGYIERSRAELSCPKPIYRELKTGWFSDRSVCYLAAGRPVIAEDTGISNCFPTGEGILTFTDLGEAIEAVRQVDADFTRQSRRARELAETVFNSDHCLHKLLASCGY